MDGGQFKKDLKINMRSYGPPATACACQLIVLVFLSVCCAAVDLTGIRYPIGSVFGQSGSSMGIGSPERGSAKDNHI